ncbi:MAG: hypothetical protein H0T74_08800 [Rubrobacteraceae bacterium]|nr:hypothetical protein [Rubrobacteraceae bacterium]
MDAPQNEFYIEHQTETLILFKIISRRSWDELQGWHRALPGSRVEHIKHGIYVLTVEPGGANSVAP